MALPTTNHGQPKKAIRNRFVFVSLPENRCAVRAMRRLARTLLVRDRRKSLPLLFLYGPPGTGKSHLANRLVEDMGRSGDCTAQMISAVDLGRLLMQPPEPGGDPRLELRACDLLVVEDIQHFPAAAADDLANLIDHRVARLRPFLGTAPVGPAALRHLPQRLTSRLAGGLVVGLEALAEPSRRLLATRLCRQRRLRVTDDVVAWLAREPGGARPLVGAMMRLEALAREVPAPLTLAAVLSALPGEDDQKESAVERIAGRVAGWFGVSSRELKGKARHQGVLWPRQVGMFLARRMTGLSLVQIGAFFGGRDHTTVGHACRKVDELRSADPALAKMLRQLEAELG